MVADELKSSLDKLLCFLYATGYSTVILVTRARGKPSVLGFASPQVKSTRTDGHVLVLH